MRFQTGSSGSILVSKKRESGSTPGISERILFQFLWTKFLTRKVPRLTECCHSRNGEPHDFTLSLRLFSHFLFDFLFDQFAFKQTQVCNCRPTCAESFCTHECLESVFVWCVSLRGTSIRWSFFHSFNHFTFCFRLFNVFIFQLVETSCKNSQIL